ncbi:hypothetical protein ACT40E_03790 [Acinetobacter baumannii]
MLKFKMAVMMSLTHQMLMRMAKLMQPSTFPKDAGYSVGDTVVIKDQDGTELVNRPLTAEDLENGITVKVTPAAEGKLLLLQQL